MIANRPIFIVIEGLDGSGKTTVGKHLAEVLESKHGAKVKSTYEPNDPSCGGDYIRQVLTKKITDFHPRVLALSFAANRLDHCSRTIIPWLAADKNRIVISDRYYLSSLVYQSSDDFSFEKVMELNEIALKPDIIFFMNVSAEVCMERMEKRNQPEELFESNLAATRNKFLSAIAFLKKTRNEMVVEIDGNGTVEQSVTQMIEALKSNI